jgi:hypothetical protein
LNVVPFGRKSRTNNRVDVKKTVTIVFLAEIFCLVLGTTSLAEVASIESPYVVSRNYDSSPVVIPSKLYSAWRAATAAIATDANRETHLGKLQIVHLQDTLKGVESAKTITTDLKREHELRRAGGRPTVVGRMSEVERVAIHGQRRILNKKNYTRSPKGDKSKIRPRDESVGW